MKLNRLIWLFGFLAIFSFVTLSSAWANMEQLKLYKQAFPGEPVKCAMCHVDSAPKKDGAHELNAYGQKVVGISKTPTIDTYKSAGKV